MGAAGHVTRCASVAVVSNVNGFEPLAVRLARTSSAGTIGWLLVSFAIIIPTSDANCRAVTSCTCTWRRGMRGTTRIAVVAGARIYCPMTQPVLASRRTNVAGRL